MSQPTPPPAQPQLHSVRCEAHGLRYNPDLYSGCVRCRRERGELPAARPQGTAGPVASNASAKAGSLGAAVGVALALIAGSGMLLYWDDLRTWEKVQEMRESGTYIEGLTPEQQEQLERRLQRQMERMLKDSPQDEEVATGED